MKITNEKDISLPMSIWLLHDEYDYNPDPLYYSATTLMRPIKQIVLAKRVPREDRSFDLSDLIASRMGTALHDSIEKAVCNNMKQGLYILGYPKDVISRIYVNPEPGTLTGVEDPIVIWTEVRKVMQVGKYKVGGKFDLVADGIIQDYKSTSAFSWVYGGKDEEHRLQLSIYKWMNPDKITEDYGIINYIFTDWMKATAAQNPKYPQSRLVSKPLSLTEPKAIQQWVEHKLNQIDKLLDADESKIPDCTPEELWMSDPIFKYFSKADAVRSSKNFDTAVEANAHLAAKGVGIIKSFPGEPKRCNYCPAFDVCKQKDRYFPNP